MSRNPFLPIPSTGIPRLNLTLKKPGGYDNWGHEARAMWWLGYPARKRKWQEATARSKEDAGNEETTTKKRVHIEDRPPFMVAEPVPMLDPVVVTGDRPKTTPTAPSLAPAPPPPADKEETATQPNEDTDHHAIDEFDDSYNSFLEAQRKETEAVSFLPRTFSSCCMRTYLVSVFVPD
jgi:hypothetical protein